MFDYSCLRKHGDETNMQTLNLKEILIKAYNPCFENNIDVLGPITNQAEEQPFCKSFLIIMKLVPCDQN